ncbi:MAG TPA: hypothetical protein DIU00_11180 [Phycisphaerales bacterium]|nr:hypothetical protein [Phycisphaerales bacterium]
MVNKLIMNGKRIILVLFVVMVCTASVHADMMPVSTTSTERGKSLYVPRGQTDLHYADSSSLLNYPSITNLNFGPVELLPATTADTGQTPEMQNIRSFTDGPGSLALCIYALIGLGLCQAAPWVKKISFEFIPEWYHDGGPLQIGHSLAVTPETLYPVPACSFVQPACMVESHIPQYGQRTIVSLWRKSQFTPDEIASRGPPDMS